MYLLLICYIKINKWLLIPLIFWFMYLSRTIIDYCQFNVKILFLTVQSFGIQFFLPPIKFSLFWKADISIFLIRWNLFPNLVKSNQIWMVITLFRLIWHHTQFRLVKGSIKGPHWDPSNITAKLNRRDLRRPQLIMSKKELRYLCNL